jgi:mRNA-degrading endonuclease RelE of RelBE toxin-antitoxin system
LAYVEGIGDESGEEMDEPVDQGGKRREERGGTYRLRSSE